MKAMEKRYFEDIEVGDSATSPGRTITEGDIVNFAGLTGDFNLIHTDAEFATSSIAGQRVAHGLLILSIASGLFTRTGYYLSMSENLTALMEYSNWKFKKPVVIGDTIHVVVTVSEKIDSKPEADSGKVVMRREVVNQRGETVQVGDTAVLFKKRSRAEVARQL